MSHTFIHFLHDAGAAAWFGGSLMGATSLNAAAAELDDPRQRARASTAGWSRWAPVNAAAVAAHVIGGTGLLLTDSHRVATQEGVGRSTAIKTLATGAALGTPTEELAGYAIHDTAPGTTAPRTHYVTGFRDGCPRQVTAALALFGDPVTHETYRYRTSSRPYGPVDTAYEAIKPRVAAGSTVPATDPALVLIPAVFGVSALAGGPYDGVSTLFKASDGAGGGCGGGCGSSRARGPARRPRSRRRAR